jgi:hypothetical protein
MKRVSDGDIAVAQWVAQLMAVALSDAVMVVDGDDRLTDLASAGRQLVCDNPVVLY